MVARSPDAQQPHTKNIKREMIIKTQFCECTYIQCFNKPQKHDKCTKWRNSCSDNEHITFLQCDLLKTQQQTLVCASSSKKMTNFCHLSDLLHLFSLIMNIQNLHCDRWWNEERSRLVALNFFLESMPSHKLSDSFLPITPILPHMISKQTTQIWFVFFHHTGWKNC